MLRRLVLACAATTIVLASVPAVSPATFIPGPNGKIVYASGRASIGIPAPDAGDGDARIWVADFPFGTPVQVTTLPAGLQHRHPNWSPDHSKIVYAAGVKFSGEYALWIADLKTGTQKEFVAKAAMQDRPSWSPDGTKIAYGSSGDLYVKDVTAAGTGQGTQLTKTADIDERPVWSPDGNTLYFNRGPAADRDLYRFTPVTTSGAATGILTGATSDWQPALSPDGKQLCFLRGPQSDEAKLRTVNVNGTGDTPFTGTGVTGALNCVWSPDGTRILYTEGAFGGGEIRSRDINAGDFEAHSGYNVAAHFDGNTDWATNFSPTCEDRSTSVGINGFVSIPLSCTDPDSGFGKAPPTPDQLDDSSMEIVSPPKNGVLGALSDDEKVIYTPNKDFKGADSFTYTGEDDESTSQPATVTIQVANPPIVNPPGGGDKTAPSISGLKVSVKKWRAGKGLASISKSPVGTTISFQLSEAASATLSFQRTVKKNGKLRYVNAGALKPLSAKAGKNKVRFQGRLTASRSLALGKYRVVVKARDAAGNQSQPRTGPRFTIVAE